MWHIYWYSSLCNFSVCVFIVLIFYLYDTLTNIKVF